MPVTVRGGDILFNDGTTQSTAAGAVNTTSVLNATAGASLGAVGTYALLRRTINANNTPGNAIGPGATLSGSVLRYTDTTYSTENGTPSGTWRCMGNMPTVFIGYDNSTHYGGTVWLRIS